MKIINRIKNQIYYLWGKEIKEAEFYLNKLKPGDIALDCGANIGKITEKMLARGAEVYAFEPNPYAFRELVRRVGDNKKAHCLAKGIYDKNITMPLYLHKQARENQLKWSVGSSIVASKGNIDHENQVKSEFIDLAEFINNFGREVGLIKMDIEGAEIEVLNRLLDSGAVKKVKWILVEAHDKRMPELKEATDKLRQRIKREKIKNINFNWE